MLLALQPIIEQQRPDWVLVYGDTNSTLAGALAGKFMGVPVAHVEAGMRSYNRTMPEETNRVLTDHISTVLLCPTPTAVSNLAHEGITRNVFLVNDVTTDSLLYNRKRTPPDVLGRCNLKPSQYYLATVHRASNTDSREALAGILDAFARLTAMEIIVPAHPRLRAALERFNLQVSANVRLIDPIGYLEMISLTSSARLVLTDSGGLQKEAYVLQVPCVTLRLDTEWVETVNAGWNRLVGTDSDRIVNGVQQALAATPAEHPDIYGNGHAGEHIVDVLASLTP
jgi:UDP-N-acetylglucosamine 2-epimerase